MTRKKYIIISVVIILISIIALIGSSYAILTMTIEGDKKISVTAGILKVDFTDGNYINLDNAAPVTDKQGLKTSPYTFTITNTGNINAYYHVSLEEETTNTLTHNYLKMRLTNDKGYDSGVVYVSDYGYATSGGYTIDRESCLNAKISNWSSSYSDCKNNDWLYNSSYSWTISPIASVSYNVFNVTGGGSIYYDNVFNNSGTFRPTVFLKSNIKIVDGNGTENNPYILKS